MADSIDINFNITREQLAAFAKDPRTIRDLEAFLRAVREQLPGLLTAKVDENRQIIAGTGLTGTHDLSTDVTLALADTAVFPGVYGDSTNYALFTVDQQGRLTHAGELPLPTATGLLDVISSTRGAVLYRGASGWAALTPGTSGYFLKTNGAGNDPAWAAGGGGGSAFEITPTTPHVADFTFQNQGTASDADGTFGVTVTAPNTSSNIRFLKYTAGVSSFSSFTIRCRGWAIEPFYDGGYSNCLILRNSGSGKIVIFGNYQRDSQILAQNWTNYTTFSGNIYGPFSVDMTATLQWRRIRVTGGNIIFEVSPDGENWGTFYNSVSVASFIGSIDEVGIGVMVNGTNVATIFQDFQAA
jgi:hypothetical protein